ncbi:MAG: DUF1778 domain-containing protein [Candidatus Nanoarchaeia archaeon]
MDETNKKQFPLRLTKGEWNLLKEAADYDKRSMASFIIKSATDKAEAIREILDK